MLQIRTKEMADKIQKIKANEKILKHRYAKIISVEPQIQLGTSWQLKQKVEEMTRFTTVKLFSIPNGEKFSCLCALK